ncbi:MAG TPA: prolyl oligopeptidase family serine peptidase [Chryseosolibacter sp.]|nr:prolyl oligopeptidase family serine peptidase [Chryseosolibacter sp.]
MCRWITFIVFLLGVLSLHAQVKSSYLYNASMPYGVLDIRTSISETHYYYLKENITFSFRENAGGVRTNAFFDMTNWDSSPYNEGHLRKKDGSEDSFIMNYRLLKPENYDENFARGYPMIVLLHGAKERGNCYYEECFHADATYDPNANNPPAPRNPDHPLLNNDYHLAIGAPQHLKARKAAAGKLPGDNTLPSNAFPGFVLMPQMMNIWDSLNVEDVIRLVQLHCRQYNIDEDRIYIEGLSIGGYAVYEALKRASWLFAAAIPMSAVTEAANIFKHNQQHRVSHIPLWVFQGGKDKDPSPAFTEEVLSKFENAGAQTKYTVYEDAGHVVWGRTFAEPDLYKWMLSKSKSDLHIAYGKTEITATFNPRLELAEGYLAYQWEKDGAVVAGEGNNKLTVTSAGVYRARFSRTSTSPSTDQWNEWSAPVTITGSSGEEGEEDDDEDGGEEDEGEEDDGEGDGEGDENDGEGDGTGDGEGGEGDGSGEDEDEDDGDDSGEGEEGEEGDGDGEDGGDGGEGGDGTGEDDEDGEGDNGDDGSDDSGDEEGGEEGEDDGNGENDEGDESEGEGVEDDGSEDGEVDDDLITATDPEGGAGIQIYPNPVHGNEINITWNGSRLLTKIQIINATGEVVLTEHLVGNQRNVQLNVSLPGGLYFISLSDGKTLAVQKILIER